MKTLLILLAILILNTNITFAQSYLKNEQDIKVWVFSDPKDLSFKWDGKTVDGYAQGNGVLEVFQNKKPTYTYTGNLQQGKMNGFGTLTWSNGNKYSGDWLDGKIHGKGTLTWANGNKYEGEWANNTMHGKGTFTLFNGTKYIGDFVYGKMHGNGIMYDKNGKILQQGRFENGRFVG